MAKKITTIQLLSEYFTKLMIRSSHHAQGVGQVALAVMGGIVWKGVDIEVLERGGDMKNVLWMKTSTSSFYFSYDHKTDEIIVKQNNHNGPELRRFQNTTPIADVHGFFNVM